MGENTPAADFILTDQFGETFQLSSQRNKVILLFFGFTYCPDVCPSTLSNWKQIENLLGNDADKIKFLYVTVDPQRDTREKIKQHLEIFSNNFIGLTGADSTLQEVYDGFGIITERVKISDSPAGYLINHTARINLIDQHGRWLLTYANNTPPEDFVHDIRILLNRES